MRLLERYSILYILLLHSLCQGQHYWGYVGAFKYHLVRFKQVQGYLEVLLGGFGFRLEGYSKAILRQGRVLIP